MDRYQCVYVYRSCIWYTYMASDRQFRMDSFVDSSVRETPGQCLAHDEIDTSETVKKSGKLASVINIPGKYCQKLFLKNGTELKNNCFLCSLQGIVSHAILRIYVSVGAPKNLMVNTLRMASPSVGWGA